MSHINGYPPPVVNSLLDNYSAEQAAADNEQASAKVRRDTVKNNFDTAFMKDVNESFRAARGQ